MFRIHFDFSLNYHGAPKYTFREVEHIPTGKKCYRENYLSENPYFPLVTKENNVKNLKKVLESISFNCVLTEIYSHFGYIYRIPKGPLHDFAVNAQKEEYEKRNSVAEQNKRYKKLYYYSNNVCYWDGHYVKAGKFNSSNEDDKRMAEVAKEKLESLKNNLKTWREETISYISSEINQQIKGYVTPPEYAEEKALYNQMQKIASEMHRAYNAGPGYWEDSPAEISILSQVDSFR